MSAQGRVQRFFASIFLENLGLKLVSILCAIGFFISIRGSERAELRFDVGIAHADPPESARRILVKEPPSQISVTLRGPRSQLETLPRDLGTLTLDLSTGRESILEIKPSMIPNLPPGVEVAQVFPSRIEVRWDDIVSRELPVQVTRTGDPAPGNSVHAGITTSPETVRATGPRTIVDLMQFARAANFDISDMIAGTHERTLALDLPPAGVDYAVPSVKATITIIREQKTLPFKAVRVEVVGSPKATTRPETVAVSVRGDTEAVSNIGTDQIVPRVELPAGTDFTKAGSMMANVIVELPGVDVTVNPKEVLVKWEAEPPPKTGPGGAPIP
ncbi:MAG: CdaR family protein [Polyangiaceae bacterium]